MQPLLKHMVITIFRAMSRLLICCTHDGKLERSSPDSENSPTLCIPPIWPEGSLQSPLPHSPPSPPVVGKEDPKPELACCLYVR